MDIKKSLEKVFNLLSTIPVQGDNVEVMYLAKQELRAVYSELKNQDKDSCAKD